MFVLFYMLGVSTFLVGVTLFLFKNDLLFRSRTSGDEPRVPAGLGVAVSVFTSDNRSFQMWQALGLTRKIPDTEPPRTMYPGLHAWWYTDVGLDIDIAILAGQTTADWTADATIDRLRHALDVSMIVVTSPETGIVRISLRVADALVQPIPLPAHSGVVDLEAVPIGRTEDDRPWALQILYRHTLIAGATGSGKGSVLWSIIAGVGPAIRDGLVNCWVADPKGGMELGAGKGRIWDRFVVNADSIIGMLTEAVQLMEERAEEFGVSRDRKFVPRLDLPLILIIIDEVAALSAYATSKQRDEFTRLLAILLTQGRAVGFSIVAALQDPSKQVMALRQLFPIRVGLRLDEPNQVSMIHGEGARHRGARCDEISTRTPGVGYVGEDGRTDFVRVRAYWVSDAAIEWLTEEYRPLPAPVDLDAIRRMSGRDDDEGVVEAVV